MTRGPSQRADGLTGALLAAGVAAGPLFMVLVSIQAVTRTGFDLTHHPASLLSLGDSGWIQVSNFIVSGLLAVAFAVGVRRALHPGRASTWGPLLLGGFGVGLLVTGLFAPDPAFGFPPGSADGISASPSSSAVLHGVGFTLAFVSVTLASILFARRDLTRGQGGWAAYAVATAVVAFALSQWPSLDGASVRFFIAGGIVWAWTCVTAFRLWATSRDGAAAIDARLGRQEREGARL